MLGSTAAMKAAKKGYKRYDVPGALAAGGGAILGIRFIKRRYLSGTSENDTGDGTATTDDQ